MKNVYAHFETNLTFWFMWILVAALPFTTVAQLTRTQIINNAAAYTTFSWTASSCNLWNGTSCGGANVYKAPWVTSAGTKTSMPYSWGGWSTTTEFNTAMSGCKSAGQVCSSAGGGCTGFPSAPLSCAGGHDCSGLVSRAWALTSKYSTSTLPNISSSIALTSTQPGDILNDAGSHVRLVETNYGNGNYQVIEASGADWKTAYHSYTTANLSGYDARCPDPGIVDGGCSILAPANDNCSGAVTFPALQPGICVGVNSGQDVSGATQSLTPNLCTGCNCTSPAAMDVWFKFTAINTSQTIQLTTSNGFDGVIEIRKGPSCNGTYLQCYDPSGTPTTILYTYNNFTVGQVYYIRVFDYGTTPPAVTTFDICIASPASSVCNITSINPSTETHNPESFSTTPGADDIIVNGQPFCTYTVTESCSWLTATPSSGTMNNVGQDFINYSIQANPNTASRSCSVSVNGSSFTIIQNGCTNDFSPSTKSVSASGTTYNLDIGSYSPCSWDISNNCPWVHLSQSSGQGDQTISVTVDPNPTCSPQTCTLTISPGNDTHTINQAGNQVPNQPSTINGLTNVCQGANGVTYSVTNVTGVNYEWTYNGTGANITAGAGTNSITVAYSSNATSGSWTVIPSNNCGPGSQRTLSVNVTQIPLQAGTINGSSTVCKSQNNVSYSVPAITNAETYIWAYSGTGHTINGSSNNITISFSSTATPGNLTVKGSNTCGQGAVSANFPITVNSPPTANAGTDATICQTSTHQLSGTAQNNSGVTWSTSGNGTFSSASSLTAIYTPGANDISAGTVTLTLTAAAISPCTVSATDTKILVIQKSPIANAGADATICQGNTHQLSGTAQYQNSVLWTTSGNGTFSSTSSLTTVYTPGVSDISAGTVTLTLTASAISPCTVSISDTKILVIQKSPTANAGTDATISATGTHTLSGSATNFSSVLWSTSGNGTFSSASSLTPVYTPGANDITNGTVTLTLNASAVSPCTISASDSKILVIQVSAIADAGFDQTICENQTALLNGLASNYSSISWTGNVSNPNILNPVYTPTPADIAAGFAELCLTAFPIPPSTVAGNDCVTIYIYHLPEVNAGADATIGETETFTTNPTIANATQTFWTTTGDGYFDDETSAITVYNPGAGDNATGSVELCLVAVGDVPCQSQVEDCMVLTIGQTTSDIITLSPGWNLISFDVTPSPATPASVFAPLIANNNLVMVTGYEQGGLLYDPNGLPFLNTLSEIKNGFGYWVKVTNATTLSVTGANISLTFAMNLKSGWNLVAYWPAQTITPAVAFAPLISLGILQTVTGYEQGGKFFDPNGPAFLNTLNEIKNGSGYWVKVIADYNGFSYPASWQCGDLILDDRDGQSYETVQIGDQCWMAESLNIGNRIDGINEQTNNGTTEKYCFDNIVSNCDIYGGLYQWDEMMEYSTIEGVQGICPTGWHLPTDTEWTTLRTYVSSQPAYLCNSNTTYIAKALVATTNWITTTQTCAVGNNLATNNATGFKGLPGGYRNTDGPFGGLGGFGYFWSSTQYYYATDAWGQHLYYNDAYVSYLIAPKGYGISVRCVRDL